MVSSWSMESTPSNIVHFPHRTTLFVESIILDLYRHPVSSTSSIIHCMFFLIIYRVFPAKEAPNYKNSQIKRDYYIYKSQNKINQ